MKLSRWQEQAAAAEAEAKNKPLVDGLSKLDAEAKKDNVPIEEKIEEVASAMGLNDPPKVFSGLSSSLYCIASFGENPSAN